MLLIIFLVLIAKLALGSDECDLGTPKFEDFDCNKFTGPRPWYFHMHNPDDFENNIDCSKNYFSRPEGNRSLTITDIYIISEKRHITLYGYITNCTSTGYFEFQHPVPRWTGQAIVLAIDYDRYFIFKHCPFESNEAYAYVVLRSPRPDEATKKEVMKILKNNNIDVNQLVKMKADHCQ